MDGTRGAVRCGAVPEEATWRRAGARCSGARNEEAMVELLRTVGNPAVLARLILRLRRVRPEMSRRWGTLLPHEMLCHLGDACEMVTRARPRTQPIRRIHRPLLKWLRLWLPWRLPRGLRTNPMHDPRVGGTRPTDFERDRQRVIAALEVIAAARADTLEPDHGLLGAMSTRDWQRWAYRHTDYHLRQFGA
jgi:hypothetical protein